MTTPSPPPASHTATEQWQSFEMRMRYRRAERCVIRAQVALEAGFEEDARAALDEAQRLNSQSPDIETIRAAIDQQTASRAAEERAVQRGRAVRAAAAAVLVLSTGAGAFWVARQAPTGGTPAAITREQAVTPPASIPTAAVTSAAVAPAALPPEALTSAPPNDPPAEPPSAPVGNSPVVTTPPVESTEAAIMSAQPQPPSTLEPARRSEARQPEPRPVATTAERTIPPASPLPPVVAARDTDADVRDRALPATPAAPERPALTPVTPQPEPIDRIAPNLPPPVVPATLSRPSAPPAETPPPADEPRVRAVLARYESAYSGLNAAEAQAVWPGVDGRSLARAFDGLESQRVSLGRCAVSVEGTTARADCRGTVTWTPKVGGGEQTASRQWSFALANANGAWQITRAQAK